MGHLFSSSRLRRCALVGIPAIALLAAGTVQAVPRPHRSECRKLTRQIERYRGVAEMAADRNDERWFGGTMAHIEKLQNRRVRLCPEYAKRNYAAIYAAWAGQMIKKGGKLFMRYITFGAYSPL